MTNQLTVAQAATELKLSPQRIRALIGKGKLKAERIGARLLLIERSDLDAVRVRTTGRPKIAQDHSGCELKK